MTDIQNLQESLKVNYEMYKETVEEGYHILSYPEWLEMRVLWLIEENKSLRTENKKEA